MRYLSVSLLFLFLNLAIYAQAPWRSCSVSDQPAILQLEHADAEVTEVPEFSPPVLTPGAHLFCPRCAHGEEIEQSARPSRLTGMEWECGQCHSIHLGTLSYER